MNAKSFENKVCLITGSTNGIGRELATLILSLGGKVVINGRRRESEASVLEHFAAYGPRIAYAAGNVQNEVEAESVVEAAIACFGRLDVVVNNAGMSAVGLLEKTVPSVIKEVVESNLSGSLLVTHFAIPHIKATKGSIVFISSLAAIHGLGGYSLYSASKMALIGVAQSLRKELSADGVHIGLLYLGFTKNDGHKKTLSATGKLETVPERSGLPVATQQESAKLIARQILERKPVVVHSAFGKLTYVLNRISPALIHAILQRTFLKMRPGE